MAEFYYEGFLEAQRLYYFFDSNSTIIDYGCGVGRVLKYSAANCKKAIGLDISEDFIIKAKNSIDDQKVVFYTTDKFKNREVADFVYCLMVMQHNDRCNRARIVKHIFDLLKPRGKALIQFPQVASDYYQETDFVHKFTKEEVAQYGKVFSHYKIISGNLINYAKRINSNIIHEYFLIVEK